MSRPRALVSGGTGFVGRFIVEALLEAGCAVTVAGRHPPTKGYFSTPVDFSPLDLDAELPAGLFEGAGLFVHGAFDHVPGKYRGGEGGDPDGFRRRNLAASSALFRAAKEAGVQRVVFLSSRAVYGSRPAGEELDERMEPLPDTLYGEVKLAAEHVLLAMADVSFVTSALRITGVYGPAGAGREHKWASLFEDYLAGRAITPRAGTEVHGRDVGTAARLMLEAPAEKVAGQVFNVSDIAVDRHDILQIVQRAAGCRHILPERADKAAVNAMRTEKLKAFGWQPGGMDLFRKTVRSLVESPSQTGSAL